jgi:mannitol-specific phosphotransferase system IIBC component
MKPIFDSTTKTGTAGGTLLTILANISSDDILKTIILAAIGAVASFFITLLLKFFVRRFRG